MQPRRDRAGLKTDIDQRYDPSRPARLTTTGNHTSSLVPLKVERQDLNIDVQDLGRARQRDLLLEDGIERRQLLFGPIRIDRDGIHQLTQRLA